MTDPWKQYDDAGRDALIRQALTVRCPRCSRPAGVPCWEWTQHRSVWPHPSRVALAQAAQ